MTPKMERLIKEALKEIEAGELSGPFNKAQEDISYLKTL